MSTVPTDGAQILYYVEVEGGPHVLCVTHAAEVNEALLTFLRQSVAAGVPA